MAPTKGPDAYYYGYAYRYDYRPREPVDLRPAKPRVIKPDVVSPARVPVATPQVVEPVERFPASSAVRLQPPSPFPAGSDEPADDAAYSATTRPLGDPYDR